MSKSTYTKQSKHFALVAGIILIICFVAFAGCIQNSDGKDNSTNNTTANTTANTNTTEDSSNKSIDKRTDKSTSFEYFQEIVKVPRPSGYMDKINEYLEEFAIIHNLSFTKDETGNIIIKNNVPGTPIILQAHQDIVGVSTNDFDFKTQPINTTIKDGWIMSDGTTTLGADNGAGIAVALYALTCDELKNVPLECLFTADEEVGMIGAINLSSDALHGNVLINLDAQYADNEMPIFIGCAGLVMTNAIFQKIDVMPSENWYTLSVGGLKGGHSGEDIDLGRANAIKLASGFLNGLDELQLSSFTGGEKANSIPIKAVVTFSTTTDDVESLFSAYKAQVLDTYKNTEPGIIITLSKADTSTKAFDGLFVKHIEECVTGVVRKDETGTITSSNLGIVQDDGDTITIIHTTRSAINSERDAVMKDIASASKMYGAKIEYYNKLPGWLVETNTPLVKKASDTYQSVFGKKAAIQSIHIGLEVGLLSEKYPDIEIICIGTQILDAHSPKERMSISSLSDLEKYTVALVKDINS